MKKKPSELRLALFHNLDDQLPKPVGSSKLQVVVEVRGGIATITECPDNVEVTITDHDNH